jgi:HPt (histidine-containing phosphotransfer) domain-containing protein
MNSPDLPADGASASVTANLTALQECATQDLESNDLARLAMMHTQCESLMSLDADVQAEAQLHPELVQGLHDALQAVILGDAVDPESVIEVVPDVIAALLDSKAADVEDLLQKLSMYSTGQDESGDADAPSGNAAQPTRHSAKGKAEFQSLVDALETPPELSNLPALAAIHTLVEQVQQAVQHDDGPIRDVARLLNQVLSGVILNELPDTQVGLQAATHAAQRCLEFFSEPDTDLSSVIFQLEAALESDDDDCSDEFDACSDDTEIATAPVAVDEPADSADSPVAEAAPAEASFQQPQSPVSSESPSSPAIEVEPYESQPLTVDLDDRENLDGFVEEAYEHMNSIENMLLEVESDPTNADTLNELFRPFHTIKGIAGFLNLRDINCLTHEAETILDMGRKGTMRITNAHVDLILEMIDILKTQVGMLAQFLRSPNDEPVPQPPCGEMIVRLRRVAAGEPATNVTSTSGMAAEVAAEQTEQTQTRQSDSKSGSETPTNPLAAAGDLSIRVDTAKLDSLVDTIGELVIAQTMVNAHETVDTNDELRRSVTQVTKIVRDVQEASMAMRMVPIGNTFQKMKRVVRDVGRKAGKQVELQLSGEETELDKNVIQQVSDPLVHMVRNAVDHGLEPPEQRSQTDKPQTGIVTLNAYHEGDNVIIEIADDGRGLDPQKLIKKGIERGLVDPDAQLSDEEAFALIVEPGFSTAPGSD